MSMTNILYHQIIVNCYYPSNDSLQKSSSDSKSTLNVDTLGHAILAYVNGDFVGKHHFLQNVQNV